MHKLDYIRRTPGIGDYNMLVEVVNQLIDKVQTKRETMPITIEREVKDYSFFKGVEVDLPFTASYLLLNPEDVYEVFDNYVFTYKETNLINNAIMEGKIVSLEIKVTEKITEKEEKQEAIFEMVESEPIDIKPIKKKRGRKKKTSRN